MRSNGSTQRTLEQTLGESGDVEDEFSPYERQYGKQWACYQPDGSAYKGTWYNNEYREGFGVHVFPNGDIYKGEFHKNLPHGYGKYFARRVKLAKSKKKQIVMSPESHPETYELKYEGQYESGYKHGFGRQYYTPEQFYCGFWEFNLRHGQGALFYAPETDRDTVLLQETAPAAPRFVGAPPRLARAERPYGPLFIGLFERDARQGEGRVVYANGDVFCGYFENNAAENQGVTYYVGRHSKAAGEYRAGACVCAAVQTEWTQLDYQAVFEAWAHVCGGYAGLGLAALRALQARFRGTWPELFRPDEAAYPYCHRPAGPAEEARGAALAALEAPEVIARHLPMRMRPEQDEVQRMLHLPLQDHGLTVPPTGLVDPVGVLNEAVAAATAGAAGSALSGLPE